VNSPWPSVPTKSPNSVVLPIQETCAWVTKPLCDQIGNQRPKNREVEDITKIAGSDERQNAPVGRSQRGVIHCLANIGLDRLGWFRHSTPLPKTTV
jgi:hypothetical protein